MEGFRWLVGAATAAAFVALAGPSLALPDWSGVWTPVEGNLFDPSAGNSVGSEGPGPQATRMYPPYKPEWEKKYLAEIEMSARGLPRDPSGACLPPGMPRLMTSPYPWEFIILPDRVVMLKELQSQVRRIFTDGRKHPPADELDPTYNGHSIGHWEGETLVIETVGLRDDTWYDRSGAQHSAKLRVVERMRKITPDLIENVMTMYDEEAFTRPWTVRRTYRREPTWQIMEFVCNENNRNMPGEDGVNQVILSTAK